MERSGSLCGRGCRSAGADAWEILRGTRSGIIEKQLPPGTVQSTIGKQLHSAKHGTTGSNCRQGNRTAPSGSNSTAQSKAPSGRATCRTAASRRASCRNASSRSSYRQGRRKAPSGSNSTVQSTAPSGSNCRQGNRTAPSGSNSTAQSKAPSEEQPAEPAASGRATCRTSSIGTSNQSN